jgi:hypothetical protein
MCFAPKAQLISKPGATPQEKDVSQKRALKARLNRGGPQVNRAFSADEIL